MSGPGEQLDEIQPDDRLVLGDQDPHVGECTGPSLVI
jgi:hypothetical protein